MRQETCTSGILITLLTIGIPATGWLAFNMAAIPVSREQWITQPGNLFPVGWVILAGFVVILLFNGISAVQSIFKLLAKRASATDSLVLTGAFYAFSCWVVRRL